MSHDKSKAAIRQRMTDTGEPYTEARRQVLVSLETVFAEPQVRREGPLGLTEPSVNFLLESTRPAAAKARETINNWYSRFPDPRGKFRARLMSPKGADYEVAQDELFVHERLAGNARISYEEGGTGPDFRLYQETIYLGAIEVLSLFMTGPWANQQNQHGRIADELNKRLVLDKWFVGFDVKQSDRDPSFKKLADWMDRTMSQLPDPAGENSRTHTATYTAPGVQLDFTFIRCGPNPAAEDRIAGAGPVIGGWMRSDPIP